MTDKERLLALLRDFGITPKMYGTKVVRLEAGYGATQGHLHLHLHPFCDFDFTDEGKFQQVGVYEWLT